MACCEGCEDQLEESDDDTDGTLTANDIELNSDAQDSLGFPPREWHTVLSRSRPSGREFTTPKGRRLSYKSENTPSGGVRMEWWLDNNKFVGARTKQDIISLSRTLEDSEERVVSLDRFYVIPEHRRRGVAH